MCFLRPALRLLLRVTYRMGAGNMIKKPWQGFLEGLETLRNHGSLLKSCFLNGRY
jgi:hypothetical protein